MTKLPKNAGVVVVGPGPRAQGGITTVIKTYRKTKFWSDAQCTHFASTTELRSTTTKATYACWRLFVFTLAVVRCRPRAASLHTSHSGSFYRKLAYLLVCSAFRVPAVLHIHPAAFLSYYEQGSALRQRLIRLAGKLSSRIVFLSKRIASDFGDIFPASKLRVLGNPVDVDYFARGRVNNNTGRPRILFLGAILEGKGVYDLVDCVPAIASEYPDVLFTFAGDRETEKLRQVVADRGLLDFVEVLGWIGGDSKLNLLHTASMLVLPSYTEGVPNVILEAMASRLPIVTTPVGGIPDILEDGSTAVFVEPGNVDDITKGILSLMQDDAKSTSLAAAAFDKAEHLYSIAAISDALAAIYDEL